GLLARSPLLAVSMLGLGLMTALASFMITGVMRGSDLLTKVRGLVLESRASDWLIGAAGVALFVTTLVVLRLPWAWLALGVLAVSMALALPLAVDRKVEAERRGAVGQAVALLKSLRGQGVSEEALRRFVRTTARDDWEEVFEALFGYEDKLAARDPPV